MKIQNLAGDGGQNNVALGRPGDAQFQRVVIQRRANGQSGRGQGRSVAVIGAQGIIAVLVAGVKNYLLGIVAGNVGQQRRASDNLAIRKDRKAAGQSAVLVIEIHAPLGRGNNALQTLRGRQNLAKGGFEIVLAGESRGRPAQKGAGKDNRRGEKDFFSQRHIIVGLINKIVNLQCSLHTKVP